MSKNDITPNFDKKSEKKTKSPLINSQHHQPGASEASGPTRIRFCAKYQTNKTLYDPKNPKNQILTVFLNFHFFYFFFLILAFFKKIFQRFL
jgi:hypothetical protein